MELYDWLVFTCRACRGVVKLSPAMAGKKVICPRCRTKITVPVDAAIVQEEASHNPLPTGRHDDGLLSQLRGGGREEWEVGNRPIGGELNFRERLTSTEAPERQPDAPDQPPVHRVNLRRRKLERTRGDFDDPEHASRRHSSRRKLRSRTQAFSDTFTRGLIVAVIIFAGIAVAMVWREWKKPKSEPFRPPPLVQEEPPGPGRTEGEIAMGRNAPIFRRIVTKFASAANIDELLPLVRDRERVEPKIRAWHSARNPWKPFAVNNPFEAAEMYAVKGDFLVINLVLENYREKPICFERKGDAYLADWESFVGYGEMSWDELKEKRPVEPVVMRVVIETSPGTDFFDDAFPSSKTHHCYELRDQAGQYSVSGYAAIDSPVDRQLRRHLQKIPGSTAVYQNLAVLALCYPAGSSSSRQVEIVEYLENGWVFRPDND